jgi:hypothetical protein
MSDADSSGFGKFVPGFDFLQNLAKGASASVPQMPNMGNWVAPTLNVEELDKRIEELKNVQFWLEQNSRALSATIQALEVQRMTLATLKGMNFNLGDVANAFKLKAADTVASTVHKATEKAAATAETVGDIAGGATKAAQAATGGLVDPLQLWGSLTQQFQQIAASALQEVTTKTAANMASGLAKEAVKSAAAAGKKVAAKAAPRKPAAKKTTKK